jgi:predicted DNA-binding protein (MmcQ/YjbR family)
MNAETLRIYALSLPVVTESFPFDEETLVFKANGKMFLLISLDEVPLVISLKGKPDDNVQLREEFPETCAGAYHMNKTHWNSIIIDGRISEIRIQELISISHQLVFKMPK